jgi:hypothetical protein
VEEGEIGVEIDAAEEESEGNATGAKARTCYIGRSLIWMHCDLRGASSLEFAGYLGRKLRRSPAKMKALSFGIFSPQAFGCRCPRDLQISWRLMVFRSIN